MCRTVLGVKKYIVDHDEKITTPCHLKRKNYGYLFCRFQTGSQAVSTTSVSQKDYDVCALGRGDS
jgi:hypothetical protein